MLNFTDNAKERVLHFLELQQSQGVSALRIAGNRREQKLWLVKDNDKTEGDVTLDGGGFTIYMDPSSARELDGATVDFISDVMQSGFKVFYPSRTWSDPLAQRVQDVIDKRINPGVASHGGNVTLTHVEGDTAYITLGGGCQGCGSADVTLKQGIEVMIKEAVPEIKFIRDTTDHASGTNPYYAANVGDSALER